MANEKSGSKTESEKEALKKTFRLIKTETPKTPRIKKRKIHRLPLFPDLPPAA